MLPELHIGIVSSYTCGKQKEIQEHLIFDANVKQQIAKHWVSVMHKLAASLTVCREKTPSVYFIL